MKQILSQGWFIVMAAFFFHAAQAQAAENGAHPDPAKLHFYLVTVDVGDSVWDNFGHSALRVVDEVRNTDTVYNWGVFEINGGPTAFAYDFFIDELQYRLATQSMSREIDNYRAQRRSVWQDELRLDAAQKQRLLVRLQWNRAAANVYYDYDYFFDNCTTRIRDYLNEALEGKLRDSLSGTSRRTFRDEVRTHYGSIQAISFALDVIMNGDIDRPMTEWEALFLPLNLRSALADFDGLDGGEAGSLLGARDELLVFERPAVQTSFYKTAALSLWLSCFFLLAMLRPVRRAFTATHASLELRGADFSMRAMGALGVMVLGASGLFGCVMLGSWFVSGHTDLHSNLNLLLFWPTDLLGVLIALKWLLFAKPWSLTHNSKPFMVYYLLAKLICAALFCVVALFGLVAQESTQIALYLVPCLFVLTLLTWIVGFDSYRRSELIW